MSPTYQPGDRLLVAADTLGSKSLRWWLNSKYSHCVPVLDRYGLTLEIRYPRPYYGSANEYLAGKHQVLHLRPASDWSPEQVAAYLAQAHLIHHLDYDLRSFGGFLLNRPKLQNDKQINCSEGLLSCDHAAGLLLERSMELISPQSYAEFAAAGLFTVVGRY